MVNRKHMIAALIDSRDFLAAKRRAETEVMLPAGPKVAHTGGTDFNDHRLIWGKLDQVRTKHPDTKTFGGLVMAGATMLSGAMPRPGSRRRDRPLTFAPGEAYQFDWNHEVVLIDGVTVTVKVAHVRLCHSRMFLVRA